MGRSRDSQAIEESNFATAQEQLKALAGHEWATGLCDDDPPPKLLIIRDHHWAVGWVEYMLIHESAAELLRAAEEIAEQLEDYPILDEDDLSAREWEIACQTWENMSVKERVAAIQRYGRGIFAARRSELLGEHNDPTGSLYQYLSSEC